MSHEIRTPLNTVFLGLKLLKEDLYKNSTSNNNRKSTCITTGNSTTSSLMLPNAEVLETIADIENSCETALNILNDLLSYEKLEAGLLKLEKTKIAAWQFVKESVRPFFIQVK